MKDHYPDMQTAIEELRKIGYTLDFSNRYDRLHCNEKKITLSPTEFEIDAVYRFEDDSDPENQSVLYAISSNNGDKGLLVNAFGIYSDPLSDEMIRKLKIHHT